MRCLIPSLTAIFLLITPFAAVSEDAPPPERTFFAPVEVAVVNVDVFVTDREGRPVVGLTPEDFEILEDGKPTEITNFYVAPGIAAGAQVGTVPSSPEEEADQDLYLIILVDDTNLTPSLRNRALDTTPNLLSLLPRNSYVMLASLTGNLRIRQTFTNDMSQVRASLENLREGGSTSLRAEGDRIRREMQTLANQTSKEGSALPDDGSLSPLEMQEYSSRSALNYVQVIKTYAASAAAQTELTVAGLERLIRVIAGLRGRKAILFITDGIEVNPGTDLFHAWEQTFSDVARASRFTPFFEAQQFDLSAPIAGLAKNANANGVAIHALASSGERVMSSQGADRAGGVSFSSGFDTDTRINTSRAEAYLATVTGGTALVNNRHLDRQLAVLAEDFGSYYSLGFRPGNAGDNRYHRIKVNVPDEKLALRHREGYQDVRDADRIVDRTLTAAVLGFTENPLEVSAESQQQQAREDGLYVVPIVVRVPLDQLSLVPQAAEHEGQVSIMVAVQDEQGGLAEMQRRQYPVRIPHEGFLAALQEDAEFIMGLVMREGTHRVAVGVRDELGRVDSTVAIDVKVGEVAL